MQLLSLISLQLEENTRNRCLSYNEYRQISVNTGQSQGYCFRSDRLLPIVLPDQLVQIAVNQRSILRIIT